MRVVVHWLKSLWLRAFMIANDNLLLRGSGKLIHKLQEGQL
jgi:hypothetical protein